MALSFLSSASRSGRRRSARRHRCRPWHELPAGAARASLSAIAGDAVANGLETAELLDVDVDQLARPLALVAAHRLGRLEVAEPVEAPALQDAADGGWREAELRRRSPCRSSVAAATPRPARPPAPGSACAGGAAATTGPRARPPLPRAIAPPTCAPSWRRARRPWPRPSGSALAPQSDPPDRLDYAASGKHSCGRPFGPSVDSEASPTSASSLGTEWTTYRELTPSDEESAGRARVALPIRAAATPATSAAIAAAISPVSCGRRSSSSTGPTPPLSSTGSARRWTIGTR